MTEAIPFLIDKRKDKTSIQFIVRIKGQRLRFVPGITIETKYWIDNVRWCKENKQYPEGYLNNIQIKKYKEIIENIIAEFQSNLVVPTQQSFKDAIQRRIDEINLQEGGVVSDEKQKEIDIQQKLQLFIPFAESYKESSDKSISTKKGYQTTINKLKEYESHIGVNLKFEDIDISFYNKLKQYLINKDHSKNYIGGLFKNIILFMGEAKAQGLCKFEKPRGFTVEREDGDSISLSIEEIKKIHDVVFTEDLVKKHFPDLRPQNMSRKLKSLNTERDRFIIGYCTALRISDYSRVNDYDLDDGLISIWTRKKDKKVYVPMHYYLKDIIARYGGLTLPKISSQKHNEQLKDICKIAGINDPVKKTITKGGVRIEEVKEKYNLVSSHTARRSGATNMYRNGIDLLYISRLLGHSKIEQTVKYLKITTKELANSLKDNPYFSGIEKKESADLHRPAK